MGVMSLVRETEQKMTIVTSVLGFCLEIQLHLDMCIFLQLCDHGGQTDCNIILQWSQRGGGAPRASNEASCVPVELYQELYRSCVKVCQCYPWVPFVIAYVCASCREQMVLIVVLVDKNASLHSSKGAIVCFFVLLDKNQVWKTILSSVGYWTRL